MIKYVIEIENGGALVPENVKYIALDKVTHTNAKSKHHVPSTVQADTLFTFTSHVDYLITTIRNSMISPRYCAEDLGYLKINGIKKMAFPMNCFCDINMHKLEDHLSWYGYYGLAFSKEWGMSKKIQPIQYVNPDSELRKDFASAFSAALKADPAKQTTAQRKMKSFLLHQLMYYKPYSGIFENRNTKKRCRKCFTDECEWRFVPDVSVAGFHQVYYDEKIINAGGLIDMSNAMSGIPEISLRFEYPDIKYIIVKDNADFAKLTTAIAELGLDNSAERELISKIIVWENSRGDF